ncbi:MAG: ABC transporter permease [Syntrophobacteraceae bacterium]|jgi:phospholipid/cholesterol/gamma-HCH transport system permease protein|nr:ABC transporter permease [Syntrophobacteraceae bacterium]
MDDKSPRGVGEAPLLALSRPSDDCLLVSLQGEWVLGRKPPSVREIEQEIRASGRPGKVAFDSRGLESWESGLLTFLLKVREICSRERIALEDDGLPPGIRRLLALATAVPERKGARREKTRAGFLSTVGVRAVAFWGSCLEVLAFIGEATVAMGRFLTGRARFQRSDFLTLLQQCGAQTLPIVSLISLLVGLILAFVGAVQLRMFGAQIYVASLVGIAMVRVMGAIMTGVIVAGRTGAAFAAELGTMQVNEEIDALKSLGIPPMEFLVLPRMLALMVMMPLLCLYADLMGILGGLIVGVFMLDLNVLEYFAKTRESVTLVFLWIGLFHGVVFGILIALSGCLRGMQCGRSASAVGQATTSAVVTSIVSIIVATAIITLVCDILNI